MIAAVDVFYTVDVAYGAAVIFQEWSSNRPAVIYRAHGPITSTYIPGKFYLRELRAIQTVLRQVQETLSFIIIDGYAQFSEDRPALGWYLYEELEGRIPVIGVAKSVYRTAGSGIAIKRGRSKNPLHISSIGLPSETAAERVRCMHGPHRIPTMLKMADRQSKSWNKNNTDHPLPGQYF